MQGFRISSPQGLTCLFCLLLCLHFRRQSAWDSCRCPIPLLRRGSHVASESVAHGFVRGHGVRRFAHGNGWVVPVLQQTCHGCGVSSSSGLQRDNYLGRFSCFPCPMKPLRLLYTRADTVCIGQCTLCRVGGKLQVQCQASYIPGATKAQQAVAAVVLSPPLLASLALALRPSLAPL